jgi:hypothetical protein
MNKSSRRPVANRERPVSIAPVLHQFDRDIFDVPIDRTRSWLEEMLAIYGTTDSIVHCFWPMSRRDDDWLVAELCSGFFNERAEFGGDVALGLVDEAATFLAKT